MHKLNDPLNPKYNRNIRETMNKRLAKGPEMN